MNCCSLNTVVLIEIVQLEPMLDDGGGVGGDGDNVDVTFYITLHNTDEHTGLILFYPHLNGNLANVR